MASQRSLRRVVRLALSFVRSFVRSLPDMLTNYPSGFLPAVYIMNQSCIPRQDLNRPRRLHYRRVLAARDPKERAMVSDIVLVGELLPLIHVV